MIRKQIYIEVRQDARLKRLARELGVSEAALVRQSLDQGLRVGTIRYQQPAAWGAITRCIRKRMQKGPLAGERTWRRDDLYDVR